VGLFLIFSAVPAPQAAEAADDATVRALVAAAQADPRAFAPLYERYHDVIYRYCYTRLGDRQAAEDATAETFLKAFANLQHFRPGIFLAWLYTIARHAVADAYRRGRRTESWDEQEQDEGAPPASAPAVVDTGREPLERLALQSALEQLPEDQRAVLELQLSGWSGPEIAAALGKSAAAVKMLRFRAMERLRQLLGDEH
jgi:RNA polymerase sigma-70 factor (ECF subfamily)